MQTPCERCQIDIIIKGQFVFKQPRYKVQLVVTLLFHVLHTSIGVKYASHTEPAKTQGRIHKQILCFDEIFTPFDADRFFACVF